MHMRVSNPALRRTLRAPSHALSTTSSSNTSTATTDSSPSNLLAQAQLPQTKTYFKITLTRSALGLGSAKKATLASLGIHRRMQTVFHPHRPEFAGKILAVKELVRVENVPEEEVRTKEEMKRRRRPQRGFEVVGRLVGAGLDEGKDVKA